MAIPNFVQRSIFEGVFSVSSFKTRLFHEVNNILAIHKRKHAGA